jgi:hypothetical protein
MCYVDKPQAVDMLWSGSLSVEREVGGESGSYYLVDLRWIFSSWKMNYL